MQVIKHALGNQAAKLGPEPAGPGGFVDDDESPRFPDAADDGLDIHRPERPQVDDFRLYPVLGGLAGCIDGLVDHRAVRQHGHVRAAPHHSRGAQG